MKTGVSLSVFKAKKGMPALFSGAGEENASLIKRLGFDGVDLFVDDPWGTETEKAIAVLEKHGIAIPVIMPAALVGRGLTLAAEDSGIAAEAVREIGEIIRLASRTGSMVSVGLVRGWRLPCEDIPSFYRRLEPQCRRLLDISVPLGVPLLLEPINRYEIDNMNKVSECAAFIRSTGLPMYIMADTFHMNIEESDIAGAFRRDMDLIRHIHFLDSNRLAPSMGHMDMQALYRQIADDGYNGYLTMEALPGDDFRHTAKVGSLFFSLMGRK